jgi:hypothetical protein
MMSSAGAAAWAKYASDTAPQTVVARVLKPRGARMSVAGSSFIVVKKTRLAAATIPGRNNGRVIVLKT